MQPTSFKLYIKVVRSVFGINLSHVNDIVVHDILRLENPRKAYVLHLKKIEALRNTFLFLLFQRNFDSIYYFKAI